MSVRLFEDVPLPRHFDRTPLVDGAAEELAEDLPGVQVCLDDPQEDELRLPRPRAQPLGRVTACRPAGNHVLATISLDTAAMGATEIADALERGELHFGAWGEAECWKGGIKRLTVTSVRITRRDARDGLGGLLGPV